MKNSKTLAVASDNISSDLAAYPIPIKLNTKLQLVELLNRPVSEIVKVKHIRKCSPETPIHDAVTLLQTENVGSVVITDGLKVLGIFTERDFLIKFALKPLDPKKEPISSFMTKNPICVQRQATIGQVLVSMGTGKFRHIIVTDNYQNVESVLSMKDLVAYLVGSISEVI